MTIVFKVNDKIKEKMIDYYKDMRREKTPPYAIFQAEEADVIITLYESGKVMFQGISADISANVWKELQTKEVINKEIDYNKYNTIGSDEVGTGDVFGPIVVCATFVSKDKQEFLRNLKVTDSKKLTDEYIKSITLDLIKEIPYSAFVLTNQEYNKLNHQEINLNKIKAILHNKVLYNMVSKSLNQDMVVVDEFASEKNYYAYLEDNAKVVKNIKFTPRAESKCLSVACASIISRYIFLKEMDKLSKSLGKEVPKGAGVDVDNFLNELVQEKGYDILNEVTKMNYKNIVKLLKNKPQEEKDK